VESGNLSGNMTFDSDDEDEDMPDLDADGKIKPKKPRIRQYTKNNKGPFVVCIRTIDSNAALKPMKLTKLIYGTCKSIIEIRQVNAHKMRVTLSPRKLSDDAYDEARREANALPMCEWNKKFKIYIPEKLVEVMGCIPWTTKESIDDFATDGEGKFKNDLIPSVKILDATRFMRKSDEAASNSLVKTNVVRITFEGLVLPDYVNLYGLLIPVREFKRRQMFCVNCLNYNHTKTHCNNKARQAVSTACLHCQGDHPSGDKNCPRRKFIEKRDDDREKSLRKKTYAEMLQMYDPIAVMPGEPSVDCAPLNLGTKRQRQQKSNSNEPASSREPDTPAPKKIRNNSSLNETPPGFRKPNIIEKDEIHAFIDSIINDLELPPFIAQLINKFFVPIVHNIVKKFTNSFTQKMSQLVKA